MEKYVRAAYIGMFEVLSDSVVIADPFLNPVSIATERITANECQMKITGVLCGAYNVYHIYDEHGEARKILVLHHQINILEFEEAQFEIVPEGTLVCCLSGAVALCDERAYMDGQFTHPAIYDDAAYSSDDILKIAIDNLSCSNEAKERLRLRLSEQDSEFITGHCICDAIRESVGWPGFSAGCIRSNHWSIDILNQLSCSLFGAIPIQGGFAALVDEPECSFCTLRNVLNGKILGISFTY